MRKASLITPSLHSVESFILSYPVHPVSGAGFPHSSYEPESMIYTVENTWKELHEARVEMAIVPFGAVEQHGHHLPLGTDWILADCMGRALAEEMGDVLL